MRTETLRMGEFKLTKPLDLDLGPAIRFKSGILRKARLWIERSDWDLRVIKMEERINLFCLSLIIALSICILPFIVNVFI